MPLEQKLQSVVVRIQCRRIEIVHQQDVSIIIKDFDGNVLYSTAIFVSTSDVFTVPEFIIDDMCLIEITYKGVCYKGSL